MTINHLHCQQSRTGLIYTINDKTKIGESLSQQILKVHLIQQWIACFCTEFAGMSKRILTRKTVSKRKNHLSRILKQDKTYNTMSSCPHPLRLHSNTIYMKDGRFCHKVDEVTNHTTEDTSSKPIFFALVGIVSFFSYIIQQTLQTTGVHLCLLKNSYRNALLGSVFPAHNLHLRYNEHLTKISLQTNLLYLKVPLTFQIMLTLHPKSL